MHLNIYTLFFLISFRLQNKYFIFSPLTALLWDRVADGGCDGYDGCQLGYT